MAYTCFSCGKEVQTGPNAQVARTETCPHCNSDLHVCLNCVHHDSSAYNECRERQAERVLDKDRSNFCDYFSFRSGRTPGKAGPGKKPSLKDLDALFRK